MGVVARLLQTRNRRPALGEPFQGRASVLMHILLKARNDNNPTGQEAKAMILCIMASIALAETPETSGQANVPAEARYAIGQAAGASAKVTALEARVAKLEKTKRTIVKSGGDTAVIEAAIVQAKDELKAAVKEYAERAEEAADRAGASATGAGNAWVKADEAADRAEAAAVRAEEAAGTSGANAASAIAAVNSLDSAPIPNRDVAEIGFYGVVGIGNGWLGRQELYVDSGRGYLVPDTTELMSNMIGGSIELGMDGIGKKGRLSLGVRGEGQYNLGGGFAGFGELVFGGWVEQTHVLRLEGFAGVSWEMIPTDAAVGDYSDRRWDVGLAVEFVPMVNFGIWFGGRFLPDNSEDFAGSNAGEAEIALRAHF